MSFRRGALNTTGVLLLALAVFYSSRYWPERMAAQGPGTKAASDDPSPDYIIHAFHAVDLDVNGRTRYELTADTLLHFPNPELARLDQPNMVFHRVADRTTAAIEPWQLSASTGVIVDNGNRVDLEGNVMVARLVEDTSARMTMETSRLTVYGAEERAETDAPVRLYSALAEVTSVGMTVDLSKGQLHLLSRVRGRYDPP